MVHEDMDERHTREVKRDFPYRASLSTLCPNTANTASFGAGSKFTFTSVDRKGGRFAAAVEEGEEVLHAAREGKACDEAPFHHRLPRKAMPTPFDCSTHDEWTIPPAGKKKKKPIVRQTDTNAASPPIPSPLPPFRERTRSIHRGKGRNMAACTRPPSRDTRPVSPAVQKFLASRQALQEKIFHDEQLTLLTMEAYSRASIVQKEEKERVEWRGRDEKWNSNGAGAMGQMPSSFGSKDDVGVVSSSAQKGEHYRRAGHRRGCTENGAPCRTLVEETLSNKPLGLGLDGGQQTQGKERVEVLLATIAKWMDAKPSPTDPVDPEAEEKGGHVRHQTRRTPPRREKWDLPEKTLRHSWEAAQEECDGRATASSSGFSQRPSPPVQATVSSAERETRCVTEGLCHGLKKGTHGPSGVATPSTMKRQERWTAIPDDRPGFSSHTSMASSEWTGGSSVPSPRAPEATATRHSPFMEDIGVAHKNPAHVPWRRERVDEERRPANLPYPTAPPPPWTAQKVAPQDQLVVPSSDAGVMAPTTDDSSPEPPNRFSLRRILNVFLPQSVPYLFLVPLILLLRLLRVDWFLVIHVLWPFGGRAAGRRRG